VLELDSLRLAEIVENFNNVTVIPWQNDTSRLAPKILHVSNDGFLKIKMPEILMLPNPYLNNVDKKRSL
jgi:hypothetical protein